MRNAPISAASVAAVASPSGSTWSVYLGASPKGITYEPIGNGSYRSATAPTDR
jgi:hypothetical protein